MAPEHCRPSSQAEPVLRARILIAHSSPEARTRIRQALVTRNCEFVEASDGTQAFMMVLASELDIAIIDLDMKPGSGLDFISALSILPTHAPRPEVIVWSDLVGTPAAEAQLKHVKVAAKLHPREGLEMLRAAVETIHVDTIAGVLQERAAKLRR